MIDMTKLIFEIDETNNEIPQLRVAYRIYTSTKSAQCQSYLQ